MLRTNPVPAIGTTALSRRRQPASSHRTTSAEDPYGHSLTGTSSTLRSVENLFAGFDGDFVTTSTPPSASSPESCQVSPQDSESDPDEPSNLDANRSPAQLREQFRSDSNEPASAQAVYGDGGRYKDNAEAVTDDEDADDELMVMMQVARRRLAFTRQPSQQSQQSQSAVTEQVGVESIVDAENVLGSFSLNNFLQYEWVGANGRRAGSGVRGQGLGEWEMVLRLDEVRSSSRKYEPRPTWEKAKKSDGFWGIQDKIWKDLEPRCRKYISESWEKLKHLFKREAPGHSQVYELQDWPRNPFRFKGKGKARGRKVATVSPQRTEAMEDGRGSKPKTGYERRLTVLGEPENGSPSSSNAALRHPLLYSEDEVIAECSRASESRPPQDQDFDPVLPSAVTQLQKSSRWGGWFSEMFIWYAMMDK
ncbi:hypothetical protein M434DRAFT_30942 [Hypoxylon sp. CO27-5]|nr:hypothetical protein M434DRAFT_30942 [Hypoxylon sp. CO27-5]